MPSVVFLRAVNVGGHQKFQPSRLAGDLAGFGAVNLGAAGTLIIRKPMSPAALRTEILRRLPFKPEMMICPGREILALARDEAFQPAPAGKDARQFVSVMAKAPSRARGLPPLPLDQPAGEKWEVRIIAIRGQFALSLWRRLGKTIVYPNAVVEKHLGIPATTRSWNTILAVCKILKESD